MDLVGFPSLYPWIHEHPKSTLSPTADVHVLARPPILSLASRTRTLRPARARSRAATAPDHPAPSMIVSNGAIEVR